MIELGNYPYVALDTETTGLRYPDDRAFCFSIAAPDGRIEYHDLRDDPGAAKKLTDQTRHWRGVMIAHNAPFDYKMLLSAGCYVPESLWDDTCTRACQIDEHRRSYSLDDLAKDCLGQRKRSSVYEELATIFGGPATRKAQIGNLHRAPPEVVRPYVDIDAELTLKLWEWQEDEISGQGIHQIVEFERRVMPTIMRAQTRGIDVDTQYAEEAADKLTPIVAERQKELNRIAGGEFNANSAPQVKEMFNPRQEGGDWWAGNVRLDKTPKGNPSLGSAALRQLADQGSEAADLILKIRSGIKTRDTFLRGHVIGSAVGGKVYPNINQNKGEDGGTGTGRLSYTEPALQQIPSRDKKTAALVKPCFLPPEGMVWVDADESSFEVRVFAHLINNREVNAIFAKNPETDFHGMVGEMTGLPRNAQHNGQPNAKQLNLSMIFNSGKGAIAEKMGMPWEWESFVPRGENRAITYKKAGPEADRVIEDYHRRLPGIREFAQDSKAEALRKGYVETEFGRRLRFPRGYKAYSASGLKIQATAADLNKENWLLIEEALGNNGHLILNTHDSYSMAMPEDDWRRHYDRVDQALSREGRLRIPLILDLNGVGRNWWEALQGDS